MPDNSGDGFSAYFGGSNAPAPATPSAASSSSDDGFSAYFTAPGQSVAHQATPSAADLVNRAKAIGAPVPSPADAQQMADDLAQIAARKAKPQAAATPPESTYDAMVKGTRQTPGPIGNVLNAFGSFTEQAQRAASLGLTDKVGALVPAINNSVANLFGYGSPQSFSDIYQNELAKERGYGQTYAENHPAASKIATGLGTLGSVGVDAAAALPATLAGKIGVGAATGAGLGAASGFGAANDQSVGQDVRDVGVGAATGAVTGAALPLALRGAGAAVNFLKGGGVDSATAELAAKAINQFGIPVRGGQISESPFVKYADSVLSDMPFSGYAAKDEAAHEAFTRAVSQTFGEDSPSLTQAVMQQAKTRLGKVFDDVASKTSIQADAQLLNDLSGIESDAGQVLPDSEFQPVKRQLDNLLAKVTPNNTIEGNAYQALTRKGAPLDRAAGSSDPNIRFYAGQIRNALDDAMERSAPPEVADELATARRQYKNMKTVEDLAEKGGPSGQISPALLLGQVRKSFPNYAYTGAGDLGDLAQIGQRFLKEPPNSGTANRTLIHSLLGVLGGGEGALLWADPSLAMKGALGAAGAATGTAVAGRVLGHLLDNPLYRAALLRSASGSGSAAQLLTNPALARATTAYLPPIAAGAMVRRNNLLEAPARAPE